MSTPGSADLGILGVPLLSELFKRKQGLFFGDRLNVESLVNLHEKLQNYPADIFPGEKLIKVAFTKPDE